MSSSLLSTWAWRIGWFWINSTLLLFLLTLHSYRRYNAPTVQHSKGSTVKLFGLITFQHLSFVVIIAALLFQLCNGVIYSFGLINDLVCSFTVLLTISLAALSKLALHLFVAIRSQITENNQSIWYKIGLILILSDVGYILYVISGIHGVSSFYNGEICEVSGDPLPMYIWYSMNDLIIGLYCLFAFILPLKNYIKLETDQNNSGSKLKEQQSLRRIVIRIMVYSSIALVSTMTATICAITVPSSGSTLLAFDTVINSFCVIQQFSSNSLSLFCCWHYCDPSEKQLVELHKSERKKQNDNHSGDNTKSGSNIGGIKMVIHKENEFKPELKKKLSLRKISSLSLKNDKSLPLTRNTSNPTEQVQKT